MKKKVIGLISVFMILTYEIHAQVNLDSAISSVSSIASSAAGVIGGLIGLVGIGRAAYKFAQGEKDAVTSLIMGIVGLALGQIAASLL